MHLPIGPGGGVAHGRRRDYRSLKATRPASPTSSRSGPASATGVLIGRTATDSPQLAPVDSESRIIDQNARKTGINDGCHAINRDGSLGNICGENNLSALAGRQGPVL